MFNCLQPPLPRAPHTCCSLHFSLCCLLVDSLVCGNHGDGSLLDSVSCGLEVKEPIRTSSSQKCKRMNVGGHWKRREGGSLSGSVGAGTSRHRNPVKEAKGH